MTAILSLRPMTQQEYDTFVDTLASTAEDEVRALGVPTLGLNVFASNAPARRLYEKAGYEITTQQMREMLRPAALTDSSEELRSVRLLSE